MSIDPPHHLHPTSCASVQAKRRSIFTGDLGTFDPSLSSLGGLFPASLRPGSARANDSRLAEIAQHLTAAFDRLTQPEQQRVCGLFNQPSIGSCLDTLLSVVSSASDTSDAVPFAPPPQASGMDPAAMFPTTAPLRMESFAAQGPSDTFTNPLHTLGSSRLSPRVTLGSSKLTPREVESMPMQAPAPVHPRPPHNREYGSALLDQLQEQQRATKRRAAAYADEPAARFPSPRRRKTGPPSSRDKVWDLLTAYEKKQILVDHMSAAEGTKALLERRAEQLGCDVVDMTDDDDWGIGFRLTECRATSEPLPKPKNCSICLRCGTCRGCRVREALRVRLQEGLCSAVMANRQVRVGVASVSGMPCVWCLCLMESGMQERGGAAQAQLLLPPMCAAVPCYSPKEDDAAE